MIYKVVSSVLNKSWGSPTESEPVTCSSSITLTIVLTTTFAIFFIIFVIGVVTVVIHLEVLVVTNSGGSLAESRVAAGSHTVAITVVEAFVGTSGVLGLINEIVGACAAGANGFVTGDSLPARIALAFSGDAFTVVAVKSEAEVLFLASVTEESVLASTDSGTADTTVLAVDTTARVLVSAINSLPAGFADAYSDLARSTIVA